MPQSAARAAAHARARQRPKQPLRGDHEQDHRRAGGRAPALGAAVGLVGRARAARNAQERRHRQDLQRHQRAHPVGRRRRARLLRPELAYLQAGRWRSAATSARASAGPPSSMPTASFPTTCATAPMREARSRAASRSSSASPSSTSSSARGCPTASPRRRPGRHQPDPAAGRGADPRHGGRHPHRRRQGLLRRGRRLHPRAPAAGVLRADQLARTAVHELSHWSGARIASHRDLSGSFGSKLYIYEELCVELVISIRMLLLSASFRPCGMPITLAPGSIS